MLRFLTRTCWSWKTAYCWTRSAVAYETTSFPQNMYSPIVIKKFIEAFTKIPDEYLRERATDVNDISKRVLKYLMDESKLHDLDSLAG